MIAVQLHPGLLRAVLEQPFDDAPRLICADWLEEAGDGERGEFVRVQCELARLQEQQPRRVIYPWSIERLPREIRMSPTHPFVDIDAMIEGDQYVAVDNMTLAESPRVGELIDVHFHDASLNTTHWFPGLRVEQAREDVTRNTSVVSLKLRQTVAGDYVGEQPECHQCRAIRLGQQRTNGPCRCSKEFKALRRREGELLRVPINGGYRWAHPCLGGAGWKWKFRRGWVESAACEHDDWEQHGVAIVSAQPITELELIFGASQPRSGASQWYSRHAINGARQQAGLPPIEWRS
jgi:uncharacterized protein (TIGR02996 family)